MEEKFTWQQINRADAEEEYRKSNQTGSRALYFAQCRSDNETWLPLLEKAYAKAHGDYNSIQGGFTGYENLQFHMSISADQMKGGDRGPYWRSHNRIVCERYT